MAIDPNGALIQTAYGGYELVSPAESGREELEYSEPGYTVNNPIEFALPKSDQVYFIFRERADAAGTIFNTVDVSFFNIEVTDATLGVPLSFIFSNFNSFLSYYDSDWEDGLDDNQKLVLSIDSGTPIDNPINRIRVIDCRVEDIRDGSVLFFRILIDDSEKTFSYLSIDSNNIGSRNQFSTAGSSISRNVNGKGDSHVLISPFAQFYEILRGSEDFSYPLNTIFYRRQSTFNTEDFTYSVSRYSHSFLQDNVRVKNVPGYPQMGVIIVDKDLYEDMLGASGDVLVEVEVRGLLSEIRDIFTLSFVRI